MACELELVWLCSCSDTEICWHLQIANCTTPANYFHLLRRQIHRQFRKPLLVFSPKNLLRHPAAKSPLKEFDDIPDDKGIQGVRFKRLIMDTSATDRSPHPPEEPGFKRVVFCSGKVREVPADMAYIEKTHCVFWIGSAELH